MRLRLAPLALLALLAAAGCDSNSSNSSLRDIAGRYQIAELEFVSSGVQPANVAENLVANETSLVIYGDDDLALLTTQRVGEGSRRTDLRVTARRGIVTFTGETAEDKDEMRRLLLPDPFSLQFNADSPRDLSSAGDGIPATANLNQYDPSRYNSGLTAVPGTLRIRLSRTL